MWGRGSAYERYIGRWSSRLAPLFLDPATLPREPDGSIALVARAWAVRGLVR